MGAGCSRGLCPHRGKQSRDAPAAQVPAAPRLPAAPRPLGGLPLSLIAAHLAAQLEADELARLAACAPGLSREAAVLASRLAAMQHGLSPGAVRDLRHLGELHATPSSFRLDLSSADFQRRPGVRLVRGARFVHPIYVGRIHEHISTAVEPPAKGDAWQASAALRRGRYRVSVSGWRNPYHGILDLSLDGEVISGSEGLDWFGLGAAEPHTARHIDVFVPCTGAHTWLFETKRCNELTRNAYWMCLWEFSVVPLPCEPPGQSDQP